ncbi:MULTISPECIES: hypothetical protein [unclassified Rhizobium]|nr:MULTISPECIES: hypothetical protein [unclassified Rhizobium]MBB3288522.1 hypothetical protein [Rhizobium sp. BK252]MBB3403341.1 hypothetical protein [Rhizobium sp. BK289]MBB3415916.1 hypothetical protein [Rhizobium sp. BK284]MBB3483804.1 hypothetical protein [Rhizobium sp. BK347]MDK4722218.1 hypothetical protein [Rhizobium sp. CNPSo 3968]
MSMPSTRGGGLKRAASELIEVVLLQLASVERHYVGLESFGIKIATTEIC